MPKDIETAIEINAPAQRVWSILMDLSRYPEWNPLIRQARGVAEVGQRVEISLSFEGGSQRHFKPRVLIVEPERELRWSAGAPLPFLFSGEHFFRLEPLGAERVRFHNGESFRGWVVPLLARTLEAEARPGFEAMNRALKERAEHAGAPP